MLILKVDYLVAICFQISYSLVPRIEICLKYFFGQKPPKTAIVLVDRYRLQTAQVDRVRAAR